MTLLKYSSGGVHISFFLANTTWKDFVGGTGIMKQKLFWGTITLCMIPAFRLSAIQRAKITQAEEVEYLPTISCKGELRQQQAKEIFMEIPLFPDRVYVQPGDYVTAGQILATIDQEQTLGLLKEQNLDLSYLNLPGLLGEYDTAALVQMVEEYVHSQLQRVQDSGLQSVQLPGQIVAPISGVVSASTTEKGMLITPFQPAFTIEPDHSYLAVVTISEEKVSQVVIGQKARITCTAIPEKEYAAEVIGVAPAAKKTLNGTTQQTVVEVILKLQQPDEDLKTGYSVKADIYLADSQTIYTIPYETILQDETGQELVYVYKNGIALPQKITTGLELEQGVQVCSGINLKDYLILNPENKQIDKSPIQLEKP